MTNQASNPNPDNDTDKKPLITTVGVGVIVELLAGAVLAVLGFDFESGKSPWDDPTTPAPTYGPIEVASTVDPAPQPVTDPPTEAPTSEAPPTDPLADVGAGDCLYNFGDADDLDLEPTDCDPGAFEVVEIFGDSGGSGSHPCQGVATAMFGHVTASGSVLCLSYLHPWGDAYYAEPGECFTRAADTTYQVTACGAGTFQVLEPRWGEHASGTCSEWEHYNGSVSFEGYTDEWDLLLCSRIQYPNDLGYGQTNSCFYASGPDDAMTFDAADCSSANVYITGRTHVYGDTGFCDGYGWATWNSEVFPDYSYTICFAWL